MVRRSATGLATAFFRLYLLESLAAAPARPAALLAAIAAERLPLAAGAFGRALQSLVEGGYVAPAAAAAVCLTSLGAAERMAERERWSDVLPTLVRLLGNSEPRPVPVVAEVAPPRARPVAEAYLDRVLVASVRERIAATRDGGPTFAVVLAQLDVDGVGVGQRRVVPPPLLPRALLVERRGSRIERGPITAVHHGRPGQRSPKARDRQAEQKRPRLLSINSVIPMSA